MLFKEDMKLANVWNSDIIQEELRKYLLESRDVYIMPLGKTKSKKKKMTTTTLLSYRKKKFKILFYHLGFVYKLFHGVHRFGKRCTVIPLI